MIRIGTTKLLAVIAVATCLPGCHVVSIEEDQVMRARRGGTFDANGEVERFWAARAAPALARAAVPLTQLLPAVDADLAAAGARFGQRTGEGAPWTFVGQGSGTVIAVDRASRQSIVEVAVAGLPQPRTVRLQVRPVVAGTAIRVRCRS